MITTHFNFSCLPIEIIPKILIEIDDILLTEKVCKIWNQLTEKDVIPFVLNNCEVYLGKFVAYNKYFNFTINLTKLSSKEKLKILFQDLQETSKQLNIPVKIQASLTLVKLQELDKNIKNKQAELQSSSHFQQRFWTAPHVRERSYGNSPFSYSYFGNLSLSNNNLSSKKWQGLEKGNNDKQ